MKVKVTQKIEYSKDDLDFNGDYWSVQLDMVLNNGEQEIKKYIDFGDSYHDKGLKKAEASIDLLKVLFGNSNITVETVKWNGDVK